MRPQTLSWHFYLPRGKLSGFGTKSIVEFLQYLPLFMYPLWLVWYFLNQIFSVWFYSTNFSTALSPSSLHYNVSLNGNHDLNVNPGTAHDAKNWRCMIPTKSNEQKTSVEFLVPSQIKTGGACAVYAPLVPPPLRIF